MVTRRRVLWLPVACLALVMSGALGLAAQSGESVDLGAIQRIKEEGFDRSQVMDTAWWLTEIHGPRLTNSPQLRAAAGWAVQKLTEWGLVNVKQEPWGAEFGRGWSNERTVVHVLTPTPWPVIAYARAWTPGTGGAVTAEAVLAPLATEADLEKFKGKLKGKVVLLQAVRPVPPLWEAPARRFTEKDLTDMQVQEVGPQQRPNFGPAQGQIPPTRRNAFLLAEGVVAVLEPGSGRGDSGSVLTGGGGGRGLKDPPVPPQLAVATEHYNRLARMLDKGTSVTLEVDVRSTFHDANLGMFNIVAEIPGTDKADEIVMLGAHFDSWHAGTGAVDNASGSAVMMEAMRILKQSGLQAAPHGTPRPVDRRGAGAHRIARVREGALRRSGHHAAQAGARQAGAATSTWTTAPAPIRGVYLQGNEAVAPIFHAWMEPFRNIGMTDAHHPQHRRHRPPGVRRAWACPGFQFIQDPVRVRQPHAPLQPGRVRPVDPRRPDEERGDDRRLRLPRRQPRADAAARRCAAEGDDAD